MTAPVLPLRPPPKLTSVETENTALRAALRLAMAENAALRARIARLEREHHG